MKKKYVIWIVGGNSVGKTTQAKLIHKYFNKLYYGDYTIIHPKPKIFKFETDELKSSYTTASPYSANLGELSDGACSGTDTLSTKAQIMASFENAVSVRPIVVVDGIMATGTWIEFLKREDTFVHLVHLDMEPESNFKRLRERRAVKTNKSVDEVELTAKTQGNLLTKLKTFTNLYNKLKDSVDVNQRIDVNVLKPHEINRLITKKVENFLNV